MLKKLFLAAALATLLSTNASADICDGTINSVAVQKDGSLLVFLTGRAHWMLCNVDTTLTYGGEEVKASACRGWQALLMAAQKSGSTIRLYTKTRACSAILDWEQAGVYFVEDLG